MREHSWVGRALKKYSCPHPGKQGHHLPCTSEAERNACMSAYPVIRNNAAPFPFHNTIPSVHDTGWYVRVYEASSTVKKEGAPSVPANVPMSSGALPPADTSNGNSLITFIFITLHCPSGCFSGHLIFPSLRAKKPAEVENGNHQERDSTMPGKITPSHSFRYRKHGLTRACARATLDNLQNGSTIPCVYVLFLHNLQCRH